MPATQAQLRKFREDLRRILDAEARFMRARARQRILELLGGKSVATAEQRLTKRYPAPEKGNALDAVIQDLAEDAGRKALNNILKRVPAFAIRAADARYHQPPTDIVDQSVRVLIPPGCEDDPEFAEKFVAMYMLDAAEADAEAMDRQALAILLAITAAAAATVAPGAADAVAKAVAEVFPPSPEDMRRAIVEEAREQLEEMKHAVAQWAQRHEEKRAKAEAAERRRKMWEGY